jgi:hypothetical protein
MMSRDWLGFDCVTLDLTQILPLHERRCNTGPNVTSMGSIDFQMEMHQVSIDNDGYAKDAPSLPCVDSKCACNNAPRPEDLLMGRRTAKRRLHPGLAGIRGPQLRQRPRKRPFKAEAEKFVGAAGGARKCGEFGVDG